MDAIAKEEKSPMELKWWHHTAIFLVACLLIVSRRPDAVFHGQFWSEDGSIFLADAYNLGGSAALFHMYAGYFHIVPRIGPSQSSMFIGEEERS